jgi:hypothetical protein
VSTERTRRTRLQTKLSSAFRRGKGGLPMKSKSFSLFPSSGSCIVLAGAHWSKSKECEKNNPTVSKPNILIRCTDAIQDPNFQNFHYRHIKSCDLLCASSLVSLLTFAPLSFLLLLTSLSAMLESVCGSSPWVSHSLPFTPTLEQQLISLIKGAFSKR